MSEKVSIIIPSHNYGFIIKETLENLQAQEYQNWEALIIDDGSTDNTEEIVSSFTRNDPRIQYHFQENKGVSAARNHGFRKSVGAYIQFLDADDLLSKQKLSKQVDFMESHSEVDISYTDHIYFENDEPTKEYPDYEMNNHHWLQKIDSEGYDALNLLIYSNIAVVSSPLLKREIVEKVKGFPEDSKYTEDWEFWFLCAIQGAHFSFLYEPAANTRIRIHNRNTSKNIQTMQAGELTFRKRIVNYVNEANILSEGEKTKLLDRNNASTQKLYKYMMYHIDLTSLEQLKVMYALTNPLKFISFCFKSLNYKRKELFKKRKHR